jgi:hypothetical protein
MTDPRRTARTVSLVGAWFAVVSAVVAFVFFIQPWRTCPDDTVPAACPALPQDAAVVTIALLVMLLAGIVAVGGLVAQAYLPPRTDSDRTRT